MSPRTFSITRDDQCGGGYALATVGESAEDEVAIAVTIGSVKPAGPAAKSGMGAEHVGWHLTHINGEVVDVHTYADVLDATRLPGAAFTMTVQKPASGDGRRRENARVVHSGIGTPPDSASDSDRSASPKKRRLNGYSFADDPNVSAEQLLDEMVRAEEAPGALAAAHNVGAERSSNAPAAKQSSTEPRRSDITAGADINHVSKNFHIPEKQMDVLMTSRTKKLLLEDAGLHEIVLAKAQRTITAIGTVHQVEKAGIMLQRVVTHCHWGVNEAKALAILRPITHLTSARCLLSPMAITLKRATTTLTVGKPTFSIGTDKACDVAVKGPMISRVHAMLEFVPARGVVYVVDTSTNGSFLNGRRLPEKSSSKVVLWHGDELLLQDPANGNEFGYIVNLELS